MENKTELINTIIDCVNDSIDLDSNKVSLGVLIALLNDNIPEQLTIGGVVKSFTAEDVVNELKENETLDDAISYFDSLK